MNMVNFHMIIETLCSLPQNRAINIFLILEIHIAMADRTKVGTDTAKESLIPATDKSSVQILRTIDAVEERLREKRSRIEELQTRRDDLVEEMRQLNESLESESADFVSNLKAVIDNLGAGGANGALQLGASTETEAPDSGAKGADGDKPAQRSAKKKSVKRSSLRWLKDKDRSGRETSKPLIPDDKG